MKTINKNVFDTRQEEGFLGNGYDWNSLATVFLEEKMPELVDALSFDSEAGLFSIGSEDVEAVKKFAVGFKALCDMRLKWQTLLSRANIRFKKMKVIPYKVSLHFLFTWTSC